jgi:hypothetical protein
VTCEAHPVYEKRIDNARKAVAIAVLVCALGAVLGVGLHSAALLWVCTIVAGACVVAVIGLAAEYLVRTWVLRPNRNLAPYQFTLAGIFMLTTAVAVICSCFKILGPMAIVWMILAMLIVACIVECVQRARGGRKGK